MTPPSLPQGFTSVQATGFGNHAGPVMRGRDNAGDVFVFDIGAQHLNGDERLHGGMMMSLASIVLGDIACDAAQAAEAGSVARPLSINCDFVSAGMPGERVEGRARITRATRTVLFISGELRVGDRVLMSATGVYAIKPADGQ